VTAMRASEVDLDRLRCRRCDHQALHSQQLQDHLNAAHADELADFSRCRCCNFLFFTEGDLKEHFKVPYYQGCKKRFLKSPVWSVLGFCWFFQGGWCLGSLGFLVFVKKPDVMGFGISTSF